MAVPKRKHSKGRTKRKRAQNSSIKPPQTVLCKHCGAEKLPHRVCLKCGKY